MRRCLGSSLPLNAKEHEPATSFVHLSCTKRSSFHALGRSPDFWLQTLLILLAPFAPFLTEELWERLGNTGSIHTARWPQVDADAIRSQVITIVVQVNGRVRDRLEVPHDLSEEEMKRQAQASEKAQRFISGQPVRKVIYVPGRLVNIVTG